MIIDDHEISRKAFCALLRSEGADVVADLSADQDALVMARALGPEVVIVDVTPAADTGFGIARRLRAPLPAPPIIILTSSTDRTRFGAQLDGHEFIAKTDICSAAIAALVPGLGRADIAPARGWGSQSDESREGAQGPPAEGGDDR
jgi:CheY-like chemotaxis protein